MTVVLRAATGDTCRGVLGLLVVPRVSVPEAGAVQLRFAQLEESDQTWDNNRQKPEKFLEGSDPQNHRKEEKKLEFEELEDDEEWYEEFLEFVTS